MGGWRLTGEVRGPNPDFASGTNRGRCSFSALINGIRGSRSFCVSLATRFISQMRPKSSSHPCLRPFETPLCCRLWPTQFLPSFTGVILCVASCCGARHEALNEGFLSAVGGFAWRGSNRTDAEQLTAQAFEAFQVTLGYCLLIEFSVRKGSGCGE